MGIKDFAAFKNHQPHLVGQPFTVENIWLPCNAKLHCNCGGTDVAVAIVNSEAMACPSCQKVYNCAFNPQRNAVEFSIAVPTQEKPAS